MGLPVERLVIATNVNDILVRTLATGTYDVREVVATSSPSMDIQVSSNFERLIFEAAGRDSGEVRRLMGSLAQSHRFSLPSQALAAIRALFAAGRADEDETAATIRTALRETSRLVDPHTAVALAVAEKESHDPAVPMIVLGTAHPAKFPDAVHAACGVRPALPEWLADLPGRREHATPMPVDQGAIERFILAASRAAREGAAA
jgi:threonine synthase